jgi:hypothetical protein
MPMMAVRGEMTSPRLAPLPLLAVLSVSGCALPAAQGHAIAWPGSDPGPQAAIHVTCPHLPSPPTAKPPLPPVSAFPQVLQPGHWEWEDGNYAWSAPQWQSQFTSKPPQWQPGHWAVNGGACVWHNGHFVNMTAQTRKP